MRVSLLILCVAAAAAAPHRAAAQTPIQPSGCTISCGCSRSSCYCSRTGGSGGSCRADASACTVGSCAPLAPGTTVIRAADATLVALRRGATESPTITALRPSRWRTVARGHSRGVDCHGTLVGEYFDARTAAASRARSRRLTL